MNTYEVTMSLPDGKKVYSEIKATSELNGISQVSNAKYLKIGDGEYINPQLVQVFSLRLVK